VLWDTEEETIVNNESREILRMLSTAFADLGNGASLLPDADDDATVADVDEVITEIYEPINNGVYRAGFATSQTAYDEAVDELFDALDRWDDRLADNRYLVGDSLTEADICMFTTLVRFDQVYHTHFMCNKRFIHQYEHLWPYLRDLYQTPGVAETVNIDHIRDHYYRTHPNVNPNRIVAPGPELDFDAPHDRDALPGGPPSALVE
jgi:putative glutathione S-transferase